jgi:flagellar hook-length control protein FliK
MPVSFNIAVLDTPISAKTSGESQGDLFQVQTYRKQSSAETSQAETEDQLLDSGCNVSDTGKGNPFSSVLKKRLLSQTQQDTDETLSSGQEQKPKIKNLPTQETKTKDVETNETAELMYASSVLLPQSEPQMDIAIKLQAASLKSAATTTPLNSPLQQKTTVTQSLNSSQQAEKQIDQAVKAVSKEDTASPQTIAKKTIAEITSEVKSEQVSQISAEQKAAVSPIEIKEVYTGFQSRVAQYQANQADINTAKPAVTSSSKISAPQIQAQGQTQAQTYSKTDSPAQTQTATEPQSQPQVKQVKSSLAASSLSSEQSTQFAVKKSETDKKTTLPDKIASGESFQTVITSQQSQQKVAENTVQLSESSRTVNADSVGRQEAMKPVDQILQQIPTTITGSSQQIRMTLTPAELGTIRITFRQEDEQVSGVLEVENAAVQRDIEKAIPQIASAMADSGIQLRRIEVIPMQNNPNSPNNQFSQDFNFADQRHPTGQASNQSSGGNVAKNSLNPNAETGQGEVQAKPQQVYGDSGLNMYA